MILWNIHIAAVIFGSRHGAYHGNVAEDCEHTKRGGSHFFCGQRHNVSHRIVNKAHREEVVQTTYYERLGEVVQRQNAGRGMWNRAFGWADER